MSFSRVKLAGWAHGEVLTASQITQLDIDHANAIDGAAGGTYDPSARIDLGGSGLRMRGTSHDITGVLQVASGGDIDVKSGGDIDVESGGKINVLSGGQANIESGGTLGVKVGSTLSLNGTLDAAGSSEIRLSGASAKFIHKQIEGNNASENIQIYGGQVWRVPSLTANRTWTITNGQQGARVLFVVETVQAYYAAIVAGGGITLLATGTNTQVRSASGFWQALELYCSSSNIWVVSGGYRVP